MNEAEAQFLAIFNLSWALAGSITVEPSGLVLEEVSLVDVPEMVGLTVQELSEQPGATLLTVQERLRRAGIRSYLLSLPLLEPLRAISNDAFNQSTRQQVVPEILGLDTEHALAALEAVAKTGETRIGVSNEA